MDHLPRVMSRALWFGVGLCLALLWLNPAFAVEYIRPTKLGFKREAMGALFATPQLACSGSGYTFSANAAYTTTYSGIALVAPGSSGRYIGYCGTINIYDMYQCPADSTPVAGWCSYGVPCVSPLVRNQSTGVCENPPCMPGTAGSVTSFSGCYDIDGKDNGCDVGTVLKVPDVMCDGACAVGINGSPTCSSVGSGHVPVTCTYSGTKTGATCTASDSVATPAGSCAPGYTSGTVNGITRCVASSAPSTTSTSSSSTVTNPDGSTTTTNVTVNNETNTTTTTVINTGAGGGPITTSTSEAPTDSSKPTGAEEERQEEFCAANPTHPMCQKSSVSGGGDCAVVPVCEGEATSCAVVLQTWKTRCALELSQADADAYVGMSSGAAAEAATFRAGTSVGMGTISEGTPWLPRGGLEDVSVTVAGQVLVVPLSRANDILEIMGMIVVAFAWLSAARIVGVW